MNLIRIQVPLIPESFRDSDKLLDHEIRSCLNTGGIRTAPLRDIAHTSETTQFSIEPYGTPDAQLVAGYVSRCLEQAFGGSYDATILSDA